MKTKQIRHCEELDKDGRDMALWTAVPTVFFYRIYDQKRVLLFWNNNGDVKTY